jgi:predicted membrane protein
MGVMLPYAKQEKWWAAPLFAFITMASFDLITWKVGIWTIVTSLTYAGIGLLFYFYYKKKKKVGLKEYLGSGVVGVLIFDFITGPIMSSWLFQMPFEVALVGQVPFTLLHLASVSIFIVILTPLLDKHLVNSESLDDSRVFSFLKTQIAQ